VKNGWVITPPDTFESVSPQDGSSLWKALDRGGACKNKKDFCPYCACTSKQCVVPRSFPCERCAAIGRQKCYHWDVGDTATYAKVQESLDHLRTTFPYLAGDQEVMSKIHMQYAPQEAVKAETNIEFSPNNHHETNKYSITINHNLKVLGLSCLGSLSQQKKRLLTALKECERFKESKETHEASKYTGAMIMVRQAVPCILHLENQCGEKIVKMLLMDTIQLTTKSDQQQLELINRVEQVVNNCILGQPWRPSNWRVPVLKSDSSKRVITDITMPNQHVRKFIKELHLITEAVFDMEDDDQRARKEAWDQCRTLWLEFMEMARKREDFTDLEINNLQDKGDKFIDAWLDLLPGNMGMTNYFHIVAAGHMKYYLKE
jgi:hypothetical protein